MNIILPLLDDWNQKHKTGNTTKKASLIALYYYDELIRTDKLRYSHRNNVEKQLIKVILNGASEITVELTAIFDEIISSKLTNHTDHYYGLIESILTSWDCFELVKCLPDYVIKLADLFWFHDSTETDSYSWSVDVDRYFGLSGKRDFRYLPASAYQTPTFQLLRFFPTKTVDFILSFTNKCVEYYSNSGLDHKPEEVRVFINEDIQIKQYISNRLWNMYRGTQVSTYLLESMHMALEKWLLEIEKVTSDEVLERWCLYLIRNSKSASISAVVASVVLAHPFKLFNVAKILFRTKEFFIYDTGRLIADQSAKGLYSMGFGFNFEDKLFRNERIKTCDDDHRKLTLEYLAFYYQFYKSEEDSEEDVKERQEFLWNLFDSYYEELPEKSLETESNKTWRLYLARMDRRKMSPEVEEKDGKVLIQWNPQLDPELQKYSDDSINEISSSMKHSSLNLWADARFRKDKKTYEKYQQYENDPQLAISEVKEIFDKLIKPDKDNYALFNRSIPAFSCSVLIRDFWEQLNPEDSLFCRDVVLEYASLPFASERYFYQISDGTEPAISVLPELIRHFAEIEEDVISLLLLLLLSQYHEISIFASRSILNSLWKIDHDAGHTIFCGYLFLKPKLDASYKKVREENYKKGIYEFSEKQVISSFAETYSKEIEDVLSKKINYSHLSNLQGLDIETLNRAFELIPTRTKNEDHKNFLTMFLPLISKQFENDDKHYEWLHRFLNKFASFVLCSSKEEIETYLKPFIDNFSNLRSMADFFQKFVSVEDRLNQYEEFWFVWEAFYGEIVNMCKKETHYGYTNEIIHNYLLAWPYWKEDAKEWHTLKDREKVFYQKISNDIGHLPSVLYSISKVLNDIGSNFIDDGITWLSNILGNNNHLIAEELEINTDYYIENVIRRYILTRRTKIKSSTRTKGAVVTILNFLVEKGSTAGYLLREDIL